MTIRVLLVDDHKILRDALKGVLEREQDIAVVGGGNSAIDCARTALRCGASSVKLVYRRSREEMPAIAEEIDAAEFEGVRLVLQRQPVGFVGNGNVTSVVLAEVEPGSPDASGRRRPVVTDRMSAPYLIGATIDFVDTIEAQGFTIDNPNAQGSCACGDSFH